MLRGKRRLIGLLLALFTVVAGGLWLGRGNLALWMAEPAPTVDPGQHLIFYNGVILTMDPDRPVVTALAIAGDRISAIGADETILAQRRPDSRVIDLAGRTLMPGFVDAHSHLFNDARQHMGLSLAEAQQLALANGITTLGNLYTTPSFLRDMQRFDERGQLRMRTSLYLIGTDNCGAVQDDWWRDHPPTDRPGARLRINGVKLFTDGGTCGAPALSYELTAGGGRGDLFFTQAELNALVADVDAAGHQLAIHALGDRAIEQALNALAATLAGAPNERRHRLEHNAVIPPDLLPRYGELGVIPTIFGTYPVCNPFGPPPPVDYQAWEWPWPALLAANPGLPVAWHGDDPYFGQVRPLDDLFSLVTRSEVGPDGAICPAPAWQQQHTLTAAQALPLMTTNGAYALFREEEVGRLVPGLYADLIVLSADPTTIDPSDIPDIAVLMTMIGGRIEYCAAGNGAAAICADLPGA